MQWVLAEKGRLMVCRRVLHAYYSTRQSAKKRIFGPFTPTRFNAINNSQNHIYHPHDHEQNPKNSKEAEKSEWKWIGSIWFLWYSRERKKHRNHDSGDAEELKNEHQYVPKQPLHGMKCHKLRFPFHEIDHQRWNEPSKNHEQVGQHGHCFLVGGRRR